MVGKRRECLGLLRGRRRWVVIPLRHMRPVIRSSPVVYTMLAVTSFFCIGEGSLTLRRPLMITHHLRIGGCDTTDWHMLSLIVGRSLIIPRGTLIPLYVSQQRSNLCWLCSGSGCRSERATQTYTRGKLIDTLLTSLEKGSELFGHILLKDLSSRSVADIGCQLIITSDDDEACIATSIINIVVASLVAR